MDENKPPKLELTYPCDWEYRLFGADEAALMAVVHQTLGDRSHTCSPGHQSEGGKWLTLAVSLEVTSDEDRIGLFETFRSHENVKLVL